MTSDADTDLGLGSHQRDPLAFLDEDEGNVESSLYEPVDADPLAFLDEPEDDAESDPLSFLDEPVQAAQPVDADPLAFLDKPEPKPNPTLGGEMLTGEDRPRWMQLGYASQKAYDEAPQISSERPHKGRSEILTSKGILPYYEPRYDPDYDFAEMESVLTPSAANAMKSLVRGDKFEETSPGDFEAAIDELDSKLEDIYRIEEGHTTETGAPDPTKWYIGEGGWKLQERWQEIRETKQKLERWKKLELANAPAKIFTGETARGHKAGRFTNTIMEDVPVGKLTASYIVEYTKRLDASYRRGDVPTIHTPETPTEKPRLSDYRIDPMLSEPVYNLGVHNIPAAIAAVYATGELPAPRKSHLNWTLDPDQTPRTFVEEHKAWGPLMQRSAQQNDPGPEDMERAIDVLEGQIEDYTTYQAIKGSQTTLLHPERDNDIALATERVQSLRGLRDVLLTTVDKMKDGSLPPGGDLTAIAAVASMASAEARNETIVLKRDDQGRLKWTHQKQFTLDDRIGEGFVGRMRTEGPGQLIENGYVEIVKMLGAAPQLVRLGVHTPFWVGKNLAASYLALDFEMSGNDPGDPTNYGIMSGSMSSKGVHSLRDSDFRRLAKISDDDLLNKKGIPSNITDSQLLAYIESRDNLEELRDMAKQANKDMETTWGAPLKGIAAVGEHMYAEAKEKGIGGYIFDNPVEALSSFAMTGMALTKGASLLAKTAPKANVVIESAIAAQTAAPATKWQKLLSATGIQRTPAEVQKHAAKQRALQREAEFGEKALEGTLLEMTEADRIHRGLKESFREAAGLQEGEVLVGGKSHRQLQEALGRAERVRKPYEGPGRKGKDWEGTKPMRARIDKVRREGKKKDVIGPHSEILYKLDPDSVAEVAKTIRTAKRVSSIGERVQSIDPILATIALPGYLARRSQDPRMQQFLLRRSDREKTGITMLDGKERVETTIQGFLDSDSSGFQEELAHAHKVYKGLPEDQIMLEAISNTLRAASEDGRIVSEHMYVMKLKDPAIGDESPEIDPLWHARTELRSAENLQDAEKILAEESRSISEGLREAGARDIAVRKTAATRLHEAKDRFRPSGSIGFHSKSKWVLSRAGKGDVLSHLHHRLEHHPAYLEEVSQLGEQMRKTDIQLEVARETKKGLKKDGASKEDIAKQTKIIEDLRAQNAEKFKELKSRGKELVKLVKDDKNILNSLGEHMSVLDGSAEIPTKGLPSLAAMTMKMLKGESITIVPAQHIRLAKTVSELRIMRKMEAEKFAEQYVTFGGQKFKAETILNQFDNFTSTKRYMDMLDSEFSLGELSHKNGWKIDTVYLDRLPMGIDRVPIGQMSNVAKHTRALRKLLMYGGMDAAEVGLLAESTFWRNIDSYTPDFYRQYTKEFNKAGVSEDMFKESMQFMLQQGYNGDRFRKSTLKAMMNISERESLGLISDPRFYVAKGIYQIVSDVRFKKFAGQIRNAKLENGQAVISGSKKVGYIRAGYDRLGRNKTKNSNKWLDLEGKWVHPEVYHHLKNSRSGHTSELSYYYNEQLMRRWKFGMTVLNPTTHLRNTFSNVIMAEMAGLDPFFSPSAKQADWKKTISEYMSREGDVIDEAMRGNLFGSTFADTELRGYMEALSEGGKRTGSAQNKKLIPQNMQELGWGFMDEYVWTVENRLRGGELTPKKLRWLRDKAKRAYVAEDEVFKLWRFKQLRILQKEFKANGGIITKDMRRALGKDNEKLLEVLNHSDELSAIKAAAHNSHKWFFDYSDIPGWVDVVRKSAMPFFTYSYNAVPRVAKWMNRNPIKAFAWRQTFDWANFTQEFMYGDPTFSDVYETQRLRSNLPAYARLTSIMLPESAHREFGVVDRKTLTTGRNARLAPSWDVQFWTQMGGLYRPSQSYSRNDFMGFVEKYIQNPIVPTLATLGNRPSWDMMGTASITSPDDGHIEALTKKTQNIMNIWTPSWAMPGIPQTYESEGKIVDIPDMVKGLGLVVSVFLSTTPNSL